MKVRRNVVEQKLDELGVYGWPIVEPNTKFTTPPPAFDVRQVLPERAGQERTAVRLHPRYNPNLPVDASKIGGDILWPADEPWPTCPETGEPFVAALIELADMGADGFWLDGFGGMNTSPVVARQFKAETGFDLPTKEDWEAENFRHFVRWNYEKYMKHGQSIVDQIHTRHPNVHVSFNTCNRPTVTAPDSTRSRAARR